MNLDTRKPSKAIRAKAAVSAGAVLLSGLGLGLAAASPASAASCYDGAVKVHQGERLLRLLGRGDLEPLRGHHHKAVQLRL